MKFLPLACVIASASAFTAPTMTFAVGKKAPAKKAAKTKPVPKPAAKKAAPKPAPKKVVKKAAPKPAPKKVVKKAAPKPAPRPVAAKSIGTVPSAAIPNEVAPSILDGSLVGDVGFDPCFLSTKADSVAPYFNGLFGTSIDGLTWYREAELMHGRIAMMAAVGFIVPGFFHWPGSASTGADAYDFPNPLDAWGGIPDSSSVQLAMFLAGMEFRRINIILSEGNRYQAGDSQKWGQGAGRYNPFNFDYTPAEYEEKQLQEIKHARLAMIGLLGLYFQANISGVGVVEQWAAAFTAPDYYAKAGYFLPEGI